MLSSGAIAGGDIHDSHQPPVFHESIPSWPRPGWGCPPTPGTRFSGRTTPCVVAVVGFQRPGAEPHPGIPEVPGVRLVALCDVDRDVLGKTGFVPARRRSVGNALHGRPQSCSRARTSTPSPSPRRTTGTPWSPSGPARPARTSTSRSRCRTTCGKAAGWSRRPASTTASFRPAPRAARARPIREALAWVARRQPRQDQGRARALLQAPHQHRQGERPAAGPGLDRLRPLVRSRPARAPDAQAAALRLALGLAHRQRRPGQPGHPPDGRRPLGARQEHAFAARAQRRRPPRLRRRRRNAQHSVHLPRLRRRAR